MCSMGDAHEVRGIGGEVRIEDLLVLYDGQVRDVHAFVLRRCGDVSLAEDLTQEVFVAAATRFPSSPAATTTRPPTWQPMAVPGRSSSLRSSSSR